MNSTLLQFFSQLILVLLFALGSTTAQHADDGQQGEALLSGPVKCWNCNTSTCKNDSTGGELVLCEQGQICVKTEMIVAANGPNPSITRSSKCTDECDQGGLTSDFTRFWSKCCNGYQDTECKIEKYIKNFGDLSGKDDAMSIFSHSSTVFFIAPIIYFTTC